MILVSQSPLVCPMEIMIVVILLIILFYLIVNSMKFQRFLTDFLAGLTVSFAALSLWAAFWLQSGRGIFAGMLAAAIIPIITSIFGGTKIQASGPTAPMTTITALVVAYGFEHYASGHGISAEHFVSLVCLLSWVIMIVMWIFRIGTLIRYIPNLVIVWFMNGISLLIWWDQIKKLFGFAGQKILSGSLFVNVSIALITLILLFILPRLIKKLPRNDTIRSMIPATLLIILVLSLVHSWLWLWGETVTMGQSINSLNDLITYMVSYIPSFWEITTEHIMAALPFALQLSLLWYLDSLLTSLVIDKMTNTETKKNKELIAQWFANGLVGMIWGIPGAQATIRSVLLIKEKAQTRRAGIFVGICTLIMVFALQGLMKYIALSIFVWVLIKAGWDVFEKDFFISAWKDKIYKNYQGIIQLFFVVYTTLITVFFDLNIAVISWTIVFLVGQKYRGFKDLGHQEDDLKEED